MNKINIPNDSVLGIHYSGMHDSSISVVSKNGDIIFASSLERYTRIKQDGSFPSKLIDLIPLEKISKIAFTNAEEYVPLKQLKSDVHQNKLNNKSDIDRSHDKQWIQNIDKYFHDKEKVFFNHHLSHASSSFYSSGLDDAICLVYDGGIANEDSFGGVYYASKNHGIEEIDLFHADIYSNITYIYTIVTAVLGYTPLKHEGKITGLAALGSVNDECRDILQGWFDDIDKIGSLFQWNNMYNEKPYISVDVERKKSLQQIMSKFDDADIAATLQKFTEEHIFNIISNIKKLDLKSKNICLSGGLFANVKLNQMISELGFENIFVVPAMGDDGTSLGSAWLALPVSNRPKKQIDNVYFGYSEDKDTLLSSLKDIKTLNIENPELFIAKQLSMGKICAIFHSKGEFGPRSLGNRTILAQATQHSINDGLNKKLSRTEFMPFAPVIRDVDASRYFIVDKNIEKTVQFMTVTVNCTELATQDCPAIVHVDNTARPQILKEETNPLIYKILTNYAEISNKFALVNTSFNIHEEPIVNSSKNAIKGFLEAGLDYLYLDGSVIALNDNLALQAKFLNNKIDKKEPKIDLKNISKEEEMKSKLSKKEQLLGFMGQIIDLKKNLKSIFFKLSYNMTLRRYANKVFVYFPSLKVKLVALRDSSYSPTITEKPVYKSDFLETIKQEIEEKAKQGDKI